MVAKLRHGADHLAAAVVGGVAELVVGLVLQLALDVEEHRLVEEDEEVGEDVVGVLLRVIREAMVALVNDLPRGVAGDDDEAGELADEAVDRAREVAVAAVVDEDVEQDVAVEDQREQGQVGPAPGGAGRRERLHVGEQQPGVEGDAGAAR
jgi:hypothetical protein